MQPRLRHPGFQLQEGVNQRLDVLDGGDAHHGADIHKIILRLEGDMDKLLAVDAVGDDPPLVRLAPQLSLNL